MYCRNHCVEGELKLKVTVFSPTASLNKLHSLIFNFINCNTERDKKDKWMENWNVQYTIIHFWKPSTFSCMLPSVTNENGSSKPLSLDPAFESLCVAMPQSPTVSNRALYGPGVHPCGYIFHLVFCRSMNLEPSCRPAPPPWTVRHKGGWIATNTGVHRTGRWHVPDSKLMSLKQGAAEIWPYMLRYPQGKQVITSQTDR